MGSPITFTDWVASDENPFIDFPAYGHVMPDSAYRSTPVGVYMFSYIMSGKGTILSKNEIIPVQAGDFCWIRKDAEVICRADYHAPYEKQWFHCRGKLTDMLCSLYNMPPVFITHFDSSVFFSEWMSLLSTPCPHRSDMEAIACKITRSISALLAEIRMHDILALPPYPESATIQIRDYLDTHLSEPISLGELAERFGYTELHIIRLFRQEFHITPIQYLHKRRIELASHLLAETSLPIRTIGTRCGYKTPSHFAATFSHYMGVTPRQYRLSKNGDNIL